ncbi:MAG: T9SS type A sorting domain-containing protein [Putridiphycobacter sp.]|nr:T9SS type A sorting domain-containing protein [Putridiphycobacter sp.]
MKQVVSLIFVFLWAFSAGCQGTIIGFSMSPVNPTNTDTIYIYTDLRFSSGDCQRDQQSHSVNGATIEANAHHCLGLLTYICSAVDTFKINPLPNGNYDFDLTLTSGGGPAPCTPGVAADDDSSFSFSVGTLGLQNQSDPTVTVYPLPFHDRLWLPSVASGTAYELLNIAGQVTTSGVVEDHQIDGLNQLQNGIYFLRLSTQTGSKVVRVVKA